jgi:putative effector of murein hydrolase
MILLDVNQVLFIENSYVLPSWSLGTRMKIGGLPALTAGLVIITGVIGAMFAAALFKLMRIEDERVKGIAMGVSAHGVGTARAWQINHTMGAF